MFNPPTKRPEVFIFEGEAKAALAAAESFTRQGFRVVIGSNHRYCVGFYSRLCRERIIIPDQRTEPDQCRDFLLNLVKQRRFEMILPLGDEVTQIVCSRREEFMKYSKLVLVPYETFLICRDKVQTMRTAERYGIPVPKTYDPQEQDLGTIAQAVDYPVLVKPAFSSGARGIRYAHNETEMQEAYKAISASFGRTFIQELIPHEGMQYKTELLLGYDGTVLGSFTYSKIRFYPPSGGSSTLNKSLYYPELVEYATRFAQSIGWYGMCDFDYIYDVRDKKPKLMEVNPRVTDTIQLASAAGVDFFQMLYKMACGEKVQPVTTYRTGLYMRFLPGELMWFLTAKGKRFNTSPNFFRFFGKDIIYLVTSLSDIGPTIGYLLENIMALLNPKERAYRFRMDATEQNQNR